MALPIIETIAAEVVARLGEISIANGFEFDVESVTRPRRIDRDFTPQNYAIVVDQSEDVEAPEYSYPGNPPAQGYQTTFNIYCYVRESDSATTSPAITENQMVAAAKKAIAENVVWYTFDGNAINAEWGAVAPFAEGQNLPFTNVNHNGATVPLVVFYRVSELDPYATR